MNKEYIKELKFLAMTIFEDKDYIIFEKMLMKKEFVKLRAFVSERFDLNETLLTLNNENNDIKIKVDTLNRMEDLLIFELEKL